MKTNNEKFKSLVANDLTDTAAKNRERINNRARLRESQDIAIKIFDKLDDLDWSQKRLADEIGVTPQQITKIVSGKANLTLETQVKLQEALDIPILASYYVRGFEVLIDAITYQFTEKYIPPNENIISDDLTSKLKEIQLSYDKELDSYSNYEIFNLSA